MPEGVLRAGGLSTARRKELASTLSAGCSSDQQCYAPPEVLYPARGAVSETDMKKPQKTEQTKQSTAHAACTLPVAKIVTAHATQDQSNSQNHGRIVERHCLIKAYEKKAETAQEHNSWKKADFRKKVEWIQTAQVKVHNRVL